MFELIPVIDIKDSVAVAGVGGDRKNYKPLQSIFSKKAGDALGIAKALPFKRVYIADLDAIEKREPNTELIKKICKVKEVIIDIGIKNETDFDYFNEIQAVPIIGTETAENQNVIEKASENFKEFFVSIDIKNNVVLSKFLPEKPLEAYREIVELGAEEIIFLNISAVGTMTFNFHFIDELSRIKAKGTEIFLGGGIKKEDIKELKKKKVDGILVGKALHSGLFDL